jgi:hypothetical protein
MIHINAPLQLACGNVPGTEGPIGAGIGFFEFATCLASLTSAGGNHC